MTYQNDALARCADCKSVAVSATSRRKFGTWLCALCELARKEARG